MIAKLGLAKVAGDLRKRKKSTRALGVLEWRFRQLKLTQDSHSEVRGWQEVQPKAISEGSSHGGGAEWLWKEKKEPG